MNYSVLSVCFFVAQVAILGFSATATAQQPGEPGWFVRLIDSAEPVDSLESAEHVMGLGEVLQLSESQADVIDFGRGQFPVNNRWPVPVTDNFVTNAFADVTIPAGNWAVGWGSDDGGRLTIPGVDFVTSFESDREWPLAEARTDRLEYATNRAHRPSYGSFTLNEPLETTIAVTMWERRSAQSFEVFYKNLDDIELNASDLSTDTSLRPSPANGWDLLGDPESMSASWNVRVPQSVPTLRIPVRGRQWIQPEVRDLVTETDEQIQQGLMHFWYSQANVSSLDAAAELYDLTLGPRQAPDVGPFNPKNTWWTGPDQPLTEGTTKAPNYPKEIIGQPRSSGGLFQGENDQYVVALSGELRFPRDGEYLFADGVDDFAAFALDVNRDGEFSDDEILINDAERTNITRESNDGGNSAGYVPVTIDVPEDGKCGNRKLSSDDCWYEVAMLVAEHRHGDAGILHWNENKEIPFPAANGDGREIHSDHLSELAIPERFMRAPGGVKVVSANLVAELGNQFPYEFEIDADGPLDQILVERIMPDGTTVLDLNGATVHLIGKGNFAGISGRFNLFQADKITGELADIVVSGLAVDTSRLASHGYVILLDDECDATSGGDLDGDGEVGFSDFLRMSAHFGTETNGVSHKNGDIDCNGRIDFTDFLVMSTNFGKTVENAASVPEPSGLAMLVGVGLLSRLLRRNRLMPG